MTQEATIKSDGRRYYISLGCTRIRTDYATPTNAKRAAERKGYTVVGDLPDPNATSVAHLCEFTDMASGQVLRLVVNKYETGATKEFVEFHGADAIELANTMFRKMGYKLVRISVNMMSGRQFVEDADTPNYLSARSEAYWSA